VVDLFCPNETCPGRHRESLVHFVSRNAMDIRGLSEARVTQLIEAGLVRTAADLYRLSAKDLEPLDGFAARSAEQLVAAIDASRSQPLARVLFALGITHVGEEAAKALARRFGTAAALEAATREEIEEVRGIGPVIAESVTDWFGRGRNRVLIEDLRANGVAMEEPQAPVAGGALRDAVVVLTGTLPTLSRADATRVVEGAGGKVTSSVSRNTTFVVAGDEAGSKMDRARALGIEVIDEAELLRRAGLAS
jgi:DNA ligase (NAD+)